MKEAVIRCDGQEKGECGDAAQALSFGKGTGGSFQEPPVLEMPTGEGVI